ncbi:MAG: hypothetical protein IPI07_16820 [Flavobacteriales bacterium]|nr:hypothetical protein [Flavobacteriales bacterium]
MRHAACTVLLVLLAFRVGAQWDVPVRIASQAIAWSNARCWVWPIR